MLTNSSLNYSQNQKKNENNQGVVNLPPHIKQEFEASLICEEIISSNFKYIGKNEVHPRDYVINAFGMEFEQTQRLNGGRVKGEILNKIDTRYNHLRYGFYEIYSYDPINNLTFLAQIKPNRPYQYINGCTPKQIKYEAPKGGGTPYLFLNIPFSLIEELAKKYHIQNLPEDTIKAKWTWVKDHPVIPITITEGAKKAACLMSNGYIAVACFSITTHSQKAEEGQNHWFTDLKPEIKWLLSEGKRTIHIAFDAENTIKIKSVIANNKQRKTLGKKLQSLGHNVYILDWKHELGKGIDDFAYSQGIEAVQELYHRALSYHRFTARLNLLYNRRLSNALEVNTEYIDHKLIVLGIKAGKIVIAIKAPQKSGKSTAIKNFIQGTKGRVLAITHRQTLSNNLANVLGLYPYSEGLKKMNLENYYSSNGLSICIDSLLKIDENEHYDYIVLDECEQLIWHILSSTTEISKIRGDIIEKLKRIIDNCISKGGIIICADADLSEYFLNWLRDLSEYGIRKDDIIAYKSTYKPFKGRKLNLCKSPEEIRLLIENSIRQNERIYISTSGQKVISLNGSINLEQWLMDLGVQENEIYRIDHETLADPDHPCFGIVDDLSRLKQARVIIATNSISTGVSLDEDVIGKIDAVYGLYSGNYPLEDFEQSLERYRGDCPRYIWMPEKVNTKIATGTSSKRKLETHFQRKITLSQQAIGGTEQVFCQKQIGHYSAFASRINGDYLNLKSVFEMKMSDKGYTIKHYELEDEYKEVKKLTKQKAKKIQEKSQRDCCYQLWKTSKPDEITYADLKKKRKKTKAERLLEARGDLNKRYGNLPEIEDNQEKFEELVLADMKGEYGKYRNRFNALMGFEVMKQYEYKKAQDNKAFWKNSEHMGYFMDEVLAGKNSCMTRMLEIIHFNVDDIHRKECEFSEDDLREVRNLKQRRKNTTLKQEKDDITRQITAIAERNRDVLISNARLEDWADEFREALNPYKEVFQAVFDIDLSNNQDNTTLFKTLLHRFGWKLESIGRYRQDGRCDRLYAITSSISRDTWGEIYLNWMLDLETFLSQDTPQYNKSVA